MTSTWEGILASIFLQIFVDFGGFWEASWDGKSSQDRWKKATKNDEKMNATKLPKKSQQEKIWPQGFPRPQAVGSAEGRVGRGNS